MLTLTLIKKNGQMCSIGIILVLVNTHAVVINIGMVKGERTLYWSDHYTLLKYLYRVMARSLLRNILSTLKNKLNHHVL